MTDGASQADFTKFVAVPTPIKVNVIVCSQESLALTTAGATSQSKFIAAFDSASSTPVKESYDFVNWFSVDTSPNHKQCGIVKYSLGGCDANGYANTIYTTSNSQIYMKTQNLVISKSG